MKRSRPVALCLLLVFAAAACGCSIRQFWSMPTAPTARVTSVTLVNQTDVGTAMSVLVELVNPNDDSLPLVDASYAVNVAGRSYSFRANPNRTLPGNGSQVVELPVAVPGVVSLDAVEVTGSITYVPPGEVRQLLTESNVPLPSATFRGRAGG